MSEGAAPPTRSASPWADVWLTPTRGGALLGLLALAAVAAWLSWLEGGVGDETLPLVLRPLLLLAAVPVLGVYARRIVLCTIEGDRPVPWLRDAADGMPWTHAVAVFAAILVTVLVPALLFSVVSRAFGAPLWTTWVVVLAGTAVAAAHLPFALASCVLRKGALGAGYRGTVRAWRADPAAARTAFWPTAAFLGLLAGSVALARWLVPHLADARPEADHLASRDLGRGVVFLVRLAAAWAALSSFRVAGLLARDVPSIREVIE